VAAYVIVPKTQTAPLPAVHWPAGLICCCTISNVYLQSTYNIDRQGRIYRES